MLVKRAKKASSGRRLARIYNPPTSMVSYRGPARERGDAQNRVTKTFTLHEQATFSSTAGSINANVYGSRPDSSGNWSSLAAAFDEYRVLTTEWFFFPANRYTKTATACAPGIGVADHDNATALVSRTDATRYASSELLSIEDPWKYTISMQEIGDAGFTDTSTPGNKYFFKLYFDGLSASTIYGYLLIRRRVQFRGLSA